jgi:hypothetical protein
MLAVALAGQVGSLFDAANPGVSHGAFLAGAMFTGHLGNLVSRRRRAWQGAITLAQTHMAVCSAWSHCIRYSVRMVSATKWKTSKRSPISLFIVHTLPSIWNSSWPTPESRFAPAPRRGVKACSGPPAHTWGSGLKAAGSFGTAVGRGTWATGSVCTAGL